MLKYFKKELYFYKMNLLFNKGLLNDKISFFDDELYDKMNNTYISCIPVSIHIKYLKPILPPGKCYDRSLYMFFCFDDAVLVRADVKDLELMYGKEKAGHGWIEIGNYVYDPSLLMKFEKDLYYKIYSPTNINKITIEDYIKVNQNYYDEVKKTSVSDFRPGGRKRTDLCVTIPLIKAIAEDSNDDGLKRELNEYLSLIEYDEKQVHEEFASKFLEVDFKIENNVKTI